MAIGKQIGKRIGITIGVFLGKIQLGLSSPTVSYFARWLDESPYFEDDLDTGKTYLIDNQTGDYPQEMVGQNCIYAHERLALDSSAVLINNSNRFIIELELYDRNTALFGYSVLAGRQGTTGTRIGLKTGSGNLYRAVSDDNTTSNGAESTAGILSGKIVVRANELVHSLEHNRVQVEAISVTKAYTIDRFCQYNVTSALGLASDVAGIKIWASDNNDDIEKSLYGLSREQILSLDIDTTDPDYYFKLNKYPDGILPDSPITYYDLMGSGVYLTLISVDEGALPITTANFVTNDGLSASFELGYATITSTGTDVRYPKLIDGSGYAGLVGTEPGFTEYPPRNNSCEQAGEVQNVDQDFIDADVNGTWQTGIDSPKTVVYADLVEDDYTKVTVTPVDDGEQFTLIGLIGDNEPWTPSYATDASDQGLTQAQVDEQLAYWAAKSPPFSGQLLKIGGTNAAPSAAGLASIDTLASQGNVTQYTV